MNGETPQFFVYFQRFLLETGRVWAAGTGRGRGRGGMTEGRLGDEILD